MEPYSRADAPFFRSPRFFVRVGGLAVLVFAGLCVLLLRAWSIQILHGPQYTSLANGQAYRTVDFAGKRGAIVDSKGRLLAGTTARIVVVADVASIGYSDAQGWHPTADGYRTLRRLSKLAHVPVRTFLVRIRRSVVRSPFAPATILPHPNDGLLQYLDERSDFPGIKTAAQIVRSYPQGAFGSEFLGLLGEASPAQLRSPRYKHAKPGETVGASGIEAEYDNVLNGGFRPARVRVDSQGRVVGPLEFNAGKSPPTLELTIDAKLQRATERALQHGIALAHANGHADANAAAAVVMNPWNGAVYALASTPTFNQVEASRSPPYLASLYRDRGPNPRLLNEATQGVFPTGSTFKPIVAEAALSEGLITPYTPQLCSGTFTIGGHTFSNVEAGVYSYMSLPTALAESCDTWFYRLGDKFYLDHNNLGIQRWAHLFGLGAPTGFDVPGESPGLVPTPGWLRKAYHQAWYEGYTINLSIGQGYLQVSPLQLAVAYSALANGGTVVRPHVGKAIVRGESVRPLQFPPARKLKLVDAWAIRDGLFQAAHSPTGTSSAVFANFPIPVAGKTGTAEAPPGSDHSWYASWAPASHPKVVVVVFVAHGGFGAEAAAPAARDIYQAFFNLKNWKPTP